MSKLGDRRSIVGIDPTHRGLAFVFFEGGVLLDWGTWRDDGNELALLDRLVDGCAADVLVIEDTDAPGCRRNARVRSLLAVIRRHAERRGILVKQVSREDVRTSWLAQGAENKHDIATRIAVMYPELQAILPKARKIFRSEDARMDIFDAVSLVVYGCASPPYKEEVA